MAKPKMQTEQHLIDEDGQRLLRSRLPRHWRLREYRPDYGLDFALELFASPKGVGDQAGTYETLGEHIFIQLKSVRTAGAKPLRLYGRHNVEKQREAVEKSDYVGTLDTVRFPLETSELVTVERMGTAVPVLLVVADLASSKCFFVCLNDYIDKILVPRHDNYRSTATRTIHVPVANEVGDVEPGQHAIRWYGKRAKLFAAFQRFVFQAAELSYERGAPSYLTTARYFASRIAAYDFWSDTEMWALIPYYGIAVQRFLAGERPGILNIDDGEIVRACRGDEDRIDEVVAELHAQEVHLLWKFLATLPRNYEDVCREWFLPTPLGYSCSYS